MSELPDLPQRLEGRPRGVVWSRHSGEMLRIGAVCAFYYLSVIWGRKLQLGFSQIAILWPANGVLTAALLLTPPRQWWRYFLFVVPVHVAAMASRPMAVGWYGFQFLHNFTVAAIAAGAMRRFAGEIPRFQRVKETTAFLMSAAFASAVVAIVLVGTVSAILPEEALIRHGWLGSWWSTAWKMILCTFVTLLGIVPGIVVWAGPLPASRMAETRRLWAPALAGLVLMGASVLALTRRGTPLYLQSAVFLVPMLFLLWSAVRFGARGAATSLLAIVCVSAWGAYRSAGPFLDMPAAERARSVQVFWILLALPGMSLAAATEERRRAEAKVVRGQERYEMATAAGHVAVWTYNYRTQEVYADPGLTVMLGYGVDRARKGGEWLARVHPDDLETVQARERQITARDASRSASGETPIPQIQYRLRCADGTYRWVSNTGTLYWEGDAPALAVGTIIDITELKRAQDASLASQKLESLGLLAGGIAHDFNNLLGSIHAHAELAEMRGNDAGPAIEKIKTISMRASEIVRQLMIYAGHENREFAPVDLSRLVCEMLALLEISIRKDAVLKTDLAGALPAVMGNEPQIRQVVMNLVLNASDALGERGGTISIATASACEEPGAESSVRLLVSDTGIGISGEAQGKIFDPFFTTKFAGRGLGLAVVQGIVRAHRGTIEVRSALGRGTTFAVLWPSAGSSPGERPNTVWSSAMEESLRSKGTVLVVEDESDLRLAVSEMLRREGYQVMEAADGTTAVDLVRENHREIDLVLLDMTIPGAASQAVVAEAARLRPDIRVVLTSAYSREKAWPAKEAGPVCGFIRKPFRLRELVGLIQETIPVRP